MCKQFDERIMVDAKAFYDNHYSVKPDLELLQSDLNASISMVSKTCYEDITIHDNIRYGMTHSTKLKSNQINRDFGEIVKPFV